MNKKIVITSAKGGTGKTVITALIGKTLAAEGKKVLLIDADMGLRGLDLSLDAANDIFGNLSDVTRGRASLDESVTRIANLPNLDLLAASVTRSAEDYPEGAISKITRSEDAAAYDIILIDSPSGCGKGFRLAAEAADQALLVTNLDPSSIRAADKAKQLLDQCQVRECSIAINRIYPGQVENYQTRGRAEIEDMLGFKIIGQIPEEPAFHESEPLEISELTRQNIQDLAHRLMGEDIPLTMLPLPEKKAEAGKRSIFSFLRRS